MNNQKHKKALLLKLSLNENDLIKTTFTRCILGEPSARSEGRRTGLIDITILP